MSFFGLFLPLELGRVLFKLALGALDVLAVLAELAITDVIMLSIGESYLLLDNDRDRFRD